MIKNTIVILFALIACGTSFSLKTVDQTRSCSYVKGCDCTPIICDIEVELIEVVNLFVDKGIAKYGEKNLCQIAQYVKEYIELYEGTEGWVVLVGSNNLMGTPFDFASRLNYNSGTYLRYLFKNKISVEIFRPHTDDEPDDKDKQEIKLKPSDLVKILDRHNLTDVDFIREIKLEAKIDPALEGEGYTFEESAEQIYHDVKGICTGEWIVWVARKGMLTNTKNSCAVYQHYKGTRYAAQYKRGDSDEWTKEVVVFSPKKIP